MKILLIDMATKEQNQKYFNDAMSILFQYVLQMQSVCLMI